MRSRQLSASAQARAQLEQRALLAARELVDRMRGYYRELEQATGASIGMHRALNAIGASPGVQASQLAEALGMQRPAVSQLLKALVGREWVQRVRVEQDQRAIRLYLTPAGARFLRATSGRAVGRLQHAIAALAEPDLRQLAVALPALLDCLPVRPLRGRLPAKAAAPALRADAAVATAAAQGGAPSVPSSRARRGAAGSRHQL
jgi:MarR family transcriptional regulator, organic hydroperoxide resistance regulator